MIKRQYGILAHHHFSGFEPPEHQTPRRAAWRKNCPARIRPPLRLRARHSLDDHSLHRWGAIASVLTLVWLVACGPSEAAHAVDTDTDTDQELCAEEGGLDRAEPCLLPSASCGYPSAGDVGYGFKKGDRFANFVMVDCAGDEQEFAQFFSPNYGSEDPLDKLPNHNLAIMLTVAAGWCKPCIEETKQLPELYASHVDRGFELVQVLFQDTLALPPTTSFCAEWAETYDLPFLVLADQIGDLSSDLLGDKGLPVNLLVDANANIRYFLAGETPKGIKDEIAAVLEDPC